MVLSKFVDQVSKVDFIEMVVRVFETENVEAVYTNVSYSVACVSVFVTSCSLKILNIS
jgi:ribosome-binding ATPase YchF (GTP1/OBG family)